MKNKKKGLAARIKIAVAIIIVGAVSVLIASELQKSSTTVIENKNNTNAPRQEGNLPQGKNDGEDGDWGDAEETDPCGLTDVICGAEAAELPKEAFATVYNAEEAQTDADPFTMANGKRVREGIVASNCYPFGTVVEVEGMGIFEVEDRMNSRYTPHCGMPLKLDSSGRWIEGERMDFFRWDSVIFAKGIRYRVIQ